MRSEYELWLINKIIYKSKNQLGNTLLYRRLNQLKRFLKRFIETKETHKLKECCENTFLVASSNIEIKHFIGLSLVVMGICARVYMLAEQSEINFIDDIFKDIV